MFTVCPSCTRQFRIYAEHIAAASGQVRCGFCHEQFNALERLYDEPLTNERILNEIQISDDSGSETLDEPEFEIPGREESQDTLISKSAEDTGQELQTAIDEIGIEQARSNRVEVVKQTLTELESEEPTIRKTEVSKKQYIFPEPEVLLEEPVIRRGWIPTLFWTTASFIALIAMVVQLAWFNRDEVLLRYPQLRPYVKEICQQFDCRIIRQRDPEAIKLVNRDVRLHPTYQDTLLVNATMKNELTVRQPYPRVQLTLFDTAGELLGYRNFLPNDYLDSSIDIDEGMPVDSPVHFVLEVSGPTAGAVSFEFRFL